MPKKMTTFGFGNDGSPDMVRFVTESGEHTVLELKGVPLEALEKVSGKKRRPPLDEVTVNYQFSHSKRRGLGSAGRNVQLYYGVNRVMFYEGFATYTDELPVSAYNRRERRFQREQRRLRRRGGDGSGDVGHVTTI